MAPTRFGRASIGDPCFVFELREGREARAVTAGRVLRFIDDTEALPDER